jgi:ATP-binding cassette subfamily B protein
LALPDYMATIINKGIVPQDTGVIYQTGAWMVAIALGGGIAMVGVSYIATKIATGYVRRIRDELFIKIESFSQIEFNKFTTASLITRATNDTQQIQQVMVLLMRLALMAPIMGIGAVIKAYNLAPSMTWIMAVSVVALISVIAVLFGLALPKFQQLQKLVDKLNSVTREILTGLRVIRAFGREQYEERKFAATNTELKNVNLFVNRLMVLLQPVMMLVMNLASIAIVWVGAYKVSGGSLQIGDMIAFMQYAIQTIAGFLMLSFIFIFVPRAWVSVKRVAEVLTTEPRIVDPAQPARTTMQGGLVEFNDVTFTYDGAEQPALEHISFTAKPGETTAFVGSTGSGKSTLISLIPRFYDVSSGSVAIDGIDVRHYTLESLRDKIGYVPQKGILFSGSITSNIAYGAPGASEKAVHHAAEVAQASEFITQLDKAYDYTIAQGGSNVSGGQKQRLAIARALAKKPEIYIFDDSFSALDFKTDSMLRKALVEETRNKTVLIVAQRISTIMDADKIVVLEDGAIVGQGKHSELLKNCKVYREIAESQLSDSELERSLTDKSTGKLAMEGQPA